MNKSKILLDNIKSMKIKYKKQTVELKSFEELLTNKFFNILSSKDKKSLFIGIEKELMSILLIPILSIKQYMNNMENPDNNILDTIKKGDKVVLRGNVFTFDRIDIDERYKKKYIYLLEKDNSITLVPYENSHLLTLYNGQASRINKVKGVLQRCNITKRFISEIMKIDVAKLDGVIKESTIIVFEYKEELYDLVNSLEIIFMEKSYLISELFPFAYYTSEENYEYFKGNRIKESPVIKFVSSISTAVDIIRDDGNVKNIVLIGEKTYKDSLETELREVAMIDSIEKILVVDTWESNFDFSLFVRDDEPYSVYALTQEVVLDNVNLYDEALMDLKSSLQRENYKLLENLINKNIDIYEVENSEVINKNIYRINEKLKLLFDYSDNNLKLLSFIKITYYLCNKIEQALLPLEKCEDNLNNLKSRLYSLKEILITFPKERIEYELMEGVISQIEEIIGVLMKENYKIKIIREKLLNDKKTLMVVRNVEELTKVEYYCRTYWKSKLTVRKLDKKISIYGNETLIIPCYFKDKYFNVLNTNMVQNVKIVTYRREKIRIKALIRKNNEMLILLLKNNKLSEDREFELPKIVEHLLLKSSYIENKASYENEEKFNNTEDEVQKIIWENKIKIFINEDRASGGKSNNKMKISKIVYFEDENYSFLSDNYHANIVDRNNNDIKQKSVSELAIGDEMIFTKSKIFGEQDIVKVVIKELLSKEEFEKEFGKYFTLNNLWKDCLRNYIRIYDLTERDISSEFEVYGKQITSAAIASWLNGSIIGPHDSGDIRTVANIVRDGNLYEKLEDVIVACKMERKIQIQIRKSIAKIIINSLVNNNEKDNDMYDIVKSTIGDLNKYAYIGTVSSIENIEEEIGSQYVNKIMERDE